MNCICHNCSKSCNRLRKNFCDTCYTKYRIHGDANFSLANFPKEFTRIQNDLIIGSLLGDASLRKRKDTHNTSLTIARARKDIDYLAWEAAIFGDEILTPSKIRNTDVFDKRTNKIYYRCEFETRALKALNTFYYKWYHNDIKVVPNDLQLNSQIISIWFCDDGCITKSKNGYYEIYLSTDGFLENEVVYLQYLLSNRYSERIHIVKRKCGQFVLHLSDYAARKLIVDIDPIFPNGMERKRKWENLEFPPVYQSIITSSQNRKTQVDEFIKANNEFVLLDLAKYLEWTYVSNNNIIYDKVNAARYLKKYLDDGSIVKIPRNQHPNYVAGDLYKVVKK